MYLNSLWILPTLLLRSSSLDLRFAPRQAVEVVGVRALVGRVELCNLFKLEPIMVNVEKRKQIEASANSRACYHLFRHCRSARKKKKAVRWRSRRQARQNDRPQKGQQLGIVKELS